jgi:hypothetical protein
MYTGAPDDKDNLQWVTLLNNPLKWHAHAHNQPCQAGILASLQKGERWLVG